MTPKYGINKTLFYRQPIIGLIIDRYLKRPLRILTLGGAHCLSDETSIERAILKHNPKNELTIVEQEGKSFDNILKSLKNVHCEDLDGKGRRFAYGTFGKSTVYVVNCKLDFQLKICADLGDSFDVIIADYFETLNYNVETDLDLIIRNRILNRKGTLFLTAANPGRAITQPCCKRILGYDTNAKKSYQSGLRNFLKYKFGLVYSISYQYIWKYANTDTSSKSSNMYVCDLVVK